MVAKNTLDEKALIDILQYARDKANNDQSMDTKKLVEDISNRLKLFVQVPVK